MFRLLLLTSKAASASATPPPDTLSLSKMENACSGYHESIMTGATDLAGIIEDLSLKVEAECEQMCDSIQQLDDLYKQRKYNLYLKYVTGLNDNYSAMCERFEPVHQALFDMRLNIHAIVLQAQSYMDFAKLFLYAKGYADVYQPSKTIAMCEFEAKGDVERADELADQINAYVADFNALLQCPETSTKDSGNIALNTFAALHGPRLRLYDKLMASVYEDNAYLVPCAEHVLSIRYKFSYCFSASLARTDMGPDDKKSLARRIRMSIFELQAGFGDAYSAFKENNHKSLDTLLMSVDPQRILPSRSSSGNAISDAIHEDGPAVKESSKSRNRRRRKH
ncbi:hypothetical protein PAPHI01_2520 [Pancytospora philotis]|nr:hypothetical protein PAPHI01_2520 [Pancytospora philotis]